MTRPWLLVLLFFRLELLVGWVTLSQSRFGAQLADIQKQTAGNLQNVSVPLIQRLGFFWSAPQVQSSASGLGGGITWAWDSTLCSKLLPLFHETVFGYQLVTCETIKAAVHRGFASWADNHPTISFVDVTNECEALGMLSPSCPLAELWVTALNTTSSGSKSAALTDTQLAALMAVPTDQQSTAATEQLISALGVVSEVGASPGESSRTAATATPSARYQSQFYFTSGRLAAGGAGAPMIETYKAVISFSVGDNFCWYLDSTFCSGFHALKRLGTPDAVLLVCRALIYSLWSIGLLSIGVQLVYLLRPQLVSALSLSERLKAISAAVSNWSVLGTALRVLLTVTPPLFFELIFLPCFECFDFEAAATHEVGHVLGFSHPDNVEENACCGYAPGSNVHHQDLAAAKTLRPDEFCADPWARVVPGVYAGAADISSGATVRDSIMKAFTQHNPRVCLTADDLEGLNVLYPHCDTPLLASDPVCFKIQHNIGYVRLGAFILIPILLSLLLLLVCNAFVRKHHLRRIRSRELVIEQKDVRIEGVERQCANARQSLQVLTEQMRRDSLTADSRVENRANELAKAALDEYAITIEKMCGPSVATAVRQAQERTEAAQMAAAAAKRPVGRAAARAPGRRTGGGGGFGVVNWIARKSGLDRLTDRFTSDDSAGRASSEEGSTSQTKKAGRPGAIPEGTPPKPGSPVGRLMPMLARASSRKKRRGVTSQRQAECSAAESPIAAETSGASSGEAANDVQPDVARGSSDEEGMPRIMSVAEMRASLARAGDYLGDSSLK